MSRTPPLPVEGTVLLYKVEPISQGTRKECSVEVFVPRLRRFLTLTLLNDYNEPLYSGIWIKYRDVEICRSGGWQMRLVKYFDEGSDEVPFESVLNGNNVVLTVHVTKVPPDNKYMQYVSSGLWSFELGPLGNSGKGAMLRPGELYKTTVVRNFAAEDDIQFELTDSDYMKPVNDKEMMITIWQDMNKFVEYEEARRKEEEDKRSPSPTEQPYSQKPAPLPRKKNEVENYLIHYRNNTCFFMHEVKGNVGRHGDIVGYAYNGNIGVVCLTDLRIDESPTIEKIKVGDWFDARIDYIKKMVRPVAVRVSRIFQVCDARIESFVEKDHFKFKVNIDMNKLKADNVFEHFLVGNIYVKPQDAKEYHNKKIVGYAGRGFNLPDDYNANLSLIQVLEVKNDDADSPPKPDDDTIIPIADPELINEGDSEGSDDEDDELENLDPSRVTKITSAVPSQSTRLPYFGYGDGSDVQHRRNRDRFPAEERGWRGDNYDGQRSRPPAGVADREKEADTSMAAVRGRLPPPDSEGDSSRNYRNSDRGPSPDFDGFVGEHGFGGRKNIRGPSNNFDDRWGNEGRGGYNSGYDSSTRPSNSFEPNTTRSSDHWDSSRQQYSNRNNNKFYSRGVRMEDEYPNDDYRDPPYHDREYSRRCPRMNSQSERMGYPGEAEGHGREQPHKMSGSRTYTDFHEENYRNDNHMQRSSSHNEYNERRYPNDSRDSRWEPDQPTYHSEEKRHGHQPYRQPETGRYSRDGYRGRASPGGPIYESEWDNDVERPARRRSPDIQKIDPDQFVNTDAMKEFVHKMCEDYVRNNLGIVPAPIEEPKNPRMDEGVEVTGLIVHARGDQAIFFSLEGATSVFRDDVLRFKCEVGDWIKYKVRPLNNDPEFTHEATLICVKTALVKAEVRVTRTDPEWAEMKIPFKYDDEYDEVLSLTVKDVSLADTILLVGKGRVDPRDELTPMYPYKGWAKPTFKVGSILWTIITAEEDDIPAYEDNGEPELDDDLKKKKFQDEVDVRHSHEEGPPDEEYVRKRAPSPPPAVQRKPDNRPSEFFSIPTRRTAQSSGPSTQPAYRPSPTGPPPDNRRPVGPRAPEGSNDFRPPASAQAYDYQSNSRPPSSQRPASSYRAPEDSYRAPSTTSQGYSNGPTRPPGLDLAGSGYGTQNGRSASATPRPPGLPSYAATDGSGAYGGRDEHFQKPPVRGGDYPPYRPASQTNGMGPSGFQAPPGLAQAHPPGLEPPPGMRRNNNY